MQPRTGNRSANNAPRNLYRTRDGRWLAVSTSSQSIAERVMRLVGREDVVTEPWFATGAGRVQHVDELDAAVADWVGRHDEATVVAEFERVHAAVAPVYEAGDIVADPQYNALGTILRMEDPDLGELAMQNVLFRMSEGQGAVRFTGRGHGADTDQLLSELGLEEGEIAELRSQGVIR
ncbi:hypothetical protein CGZ93_18085 [Enemella dayhoffiae]|uniref:CoA transferase n=1 Tax=Enemella dayhoffiae TaxID=2016507 RepID=A0A255GLH4_9ACTN|nr:CoA transferase [Enemella dayhoffiae]OYO16669.1 hypothetical protein CGZ93_18085 [Enemella dayhoffiae]